jgi:5-(carboxyamino)imidazole ribonucleotide mutase
MPRGVVVATVAIDGSFNAGILAASIIGNFDEKVKSNLEKWRRVQTLSVKKKPK